MSHLQKYRISPDFYKGTEPAEDGYLYQVEDADPLIAKLEAENKKLRRLLQRDSRKSKSKFDEWVKRELGALEE